MELLQLLETIDSLQRAPVTERARFPTAGSPYQPLLMLSLVRLFRRAERANAIVGYQECKDEYRLLYEGLYGPQEESTFPPKIVQPFWVFGSRRSLKHPLWTLTARDGKEPELAEEIANRRDPVKTEARLTELVEHAVLEDDIFLLLRSEIARQAITAFTLQRYFRSPEQIVNEL